MKYDRKNKPCPSDLAEHLRMSKVSQLTTGILQAHNSCPGSLSAQHPAWEKGNPIIPEYFPSLQHVVVWGISVPEHVLSQLNLLTGLILSSCCLKSCKLTSHINKILLPQQQELTAPYGAKNRTLLVLDRTSPDFIWWSPDSAGQIPNDQYL